MGWSEIFWRSVAFYAFARHISATCSAVGSVTFIFLIIRPYNTAMADGVEQQRDDRVDAAAVQALARTALQEDLGSGDLTAALIPANQRVEARLVCRQQAVLCGARWFEAVLSLVDEAIEVSWALADGEHLRPGQTVCGLHGPARAILTAERTAINLLQTLSATATAAQRYVAAVAGTGCRILDTRKTLPGLRLAQKYAVRVGGAENHRVGLFDGVLIKENHIACAGSVQAAVSAALAAAPDCALLEVEVESLAQLEQALAAGAGRVMLDNFDLAMMRAGVKLAAGRVELEVSGNVTLDNVREIALTGVTYISVGAITKHVDAVDFSLRVLEGLTGCGALFAVAGAIDDEDTTPGQTPDNTTD